VQAEPLRPTRVHRFYKGGALLGRLRGRPEEDRFLPEDWIGSVTPAGNPGRADPEEGLSRLVDGRFLRDAVQADPIGWLGEEHVASFGTSTGLLVKLLDTAERLPVHAHPDRAFAARELGSRFGKTEAWMILETRDEHGEAWVGLTEPVDVATYRGYIERQDSKAMLRSLNRITVRAGDVVFVPAGVPHAIGAGVLLLELQEPTDFSLVCEWKGFPIRTDDAHLSLGWDTAIQALDLDRHDPVLALPDEARSFFFADAVAAPAGRFAVLLTLEGEGAVDGRPARAGDAFAMPASADAFDVAGGLRMLRCLAPDPR
jgi:mannose-6-phosphate isomerase